MLMCGHVPIFRKPDRALWLVLGRGSLVPKLVSRSDGRARLGAYRSVIKGGWSFSWFL